MDFIANANNNYIHYTILCIINHQIKKGVFIQFRIFPTTHKK